MNRIKLLFLTLLLLLITGCASSPQMEEGGIGGTGHADKCDENNEECHDRQAQ